MMFIHSYAKINGLNESVYVAAFAGLPGPKIWEIRRWCWQTYGDPGYRTDIDLTVWRDALTYGEVEFARESDLALFLLRWS